MAAPDRGRFPPEPKSALGSESVRNRHLRPHETRHTGTARNPGPTRIRSAGASLRPATRAGRRGRDPRLRGRSARPRPGPARRPAGRGGAARGGRGHGHAAWARVGPRPRRLRRRPGAVVPVDRPPAVPVVHPLRPDAGGRGVRRRRRRLVDLRRLVARGLGRRPRRERDAPLDRRPRRPAAGGRRRVRPRWHHREPVRAGGRQAHRPAQSLGGRFRRPALAGRHDLRRPLLDPVGLRRHGRPADDRLRRRPLAADRRQPPTDPRGQRPEDLLRRRRDRRHHELRHRRRPRVGGRGLRGVRHLVPRRRGLRRGRARRTVGPPPLRRRGARRLVHRRPAQVAVRAVRLLRADLPRTRSRPGGAYPARRLPGRPDRRDRLEPHRLLRRPHPTGSGAPALVLARRPRHRGVLRGRSSAPSRSPGSPRPRSAGANGWSCCASATCR